MNRRSRLSARKLPTSKHHTTSWHFGKKAFAIPFGYTDYDKSVLRYDNCVRQLIQAVRCMTQSTSPTSSFHNLVPTHFLTRNGQNLNSSCDFNYFSEFECKFHFGIRICNIKNCRNSGFFNLTLFARSILDHTM